MRGGGFGWEAKQAKKEAVELLCYAVTSHPPIHYIRHITAFAEELHNPFAGSRQLRPRRFRIRVLLQPSNLISVENEIHLSQTAALQSDERRNFLRLS